MMIFDIDAGHAAMPRYSHRFRERAAGEVNDLIARDTPDLLDDRVSFPSGDTSPNMIAIYCFITCRLAFASGLFILAQARAFDFVRAKDILDTMIMRDTHAYNTLQFHISAIFM